jgi:hypothetical protein
LRVAAKGEAIEVADAVVALARGVADVSLPATLTIACTSRLIGNTTGATRTARVANRHSNSGMRAGAVSCVGACLSTDATIANQSEVTLIVGAASCIDGSVATTHATTTIRCAIGRLDTVTPSVAGTTSPEIARSAYSADA